MSLDRAKLNELMDTVTAALAPHGFECIEAEWQGHDRILRLYVDRLAGDTAPTQAEGEPPAQGVNLDDCAKVSRMLDEHAGIDDLVNGAYTLEVSSPGVERPLRRLADFARHQGHRVSARLQVKHGERRQGTGLLTSVEGDAITLDTPEGVWTFPIEALHRAHLVYDWDRPNQA